MRQLFWGVSLCSLAMVLPALGQSTPSVEEAQAVLETRWQELAVSSVEERTVLFTDVTPLSAGNGEYQFSVTAVIHDYDDGYAANGYFGQTCIMPIKQEPYALSLSSDGTWKVRGRMVVNDEVECQSNPAAGASAFPLDSLAGSQTTASVPEAVPQDLTAGSLVQGEWACWGYDLELMFGLFLNEDGFYTELDGSGGGSYALATDGTLQFHGGSMDGFAGYDLQADEFKLSNEVVCQPWRP